MAMPPIGHKPPSFGENLWNAGKVLFAPLDIVTNLCQGEGVGQAVKSTGQDIGSGFKGLAQAAGHFLGLS